MNAKTIGASTSDALEKELDGLLATGWHPTLALVFCSVTHDLTGISTLFEKRGIRLFGCTTGGEICNDRSGTGSISTLLLDMNPAHFELLYGEYREKAPEELAAELAEQARNCFPRPAILTCNSIDSPSEMDLGERMLDRIMKVAGEDTQVWGGGAGDDMRFRETFVFTNGQGGNRALLMLVFDSEKVTVRGHAATGMKPAGTEKTITRAEGKWIVEIDHKPAAEFIPRFVGKTLSREEYKDFTIQDIYMGLYRGNGEPVIRSAMGFNWENKAIAVSGTVREGDRIRLMLPPDFEVLDDMQEQTRQFKQNEMSAADALVMFSCIGRLGVLGPLVEEELKAVRSVYDVPMAGMFSYGEYGKATGGENEFHNMTCCWVAIKEIKNQPYDKSDRAVRTSRRPRRL